MVAHEILYKPARRCYVIILVGSLYILYESIHQRYYPSVYLRTFIDRDLRGADRRKVAARSKAIETFPGRLQAYREDSRALRELESRQRVPKRSAPVTEVRRVRSVPVMVLGLILAAAGLVLGAMFTPYAVALFCFGCALGSTRDDVRRAMLRFCSLPLVLLYLAVTAAGVYFGIDILGKEGADVTSKPLIVSLISFCVFYQLARYLELHLPALARFALAYAPVTFLTFATHSLIYMFAIPDDWATSEGFLLCLPLLIFALQALLFALLKPRLVRSSAGRFALHLFAHYKARPDDLEPAPQAVADSADGSAQRDGARP